MVIQEVLRDCVDEFEIQEEQKWKTGSKEVQERHLQTDLLE